MTTRRGRKPVRLAIAGPMTRSAALIVSTLVLACAGDACGPAYLGDLPEASEGSEGSGGDDADDRVWHTLEATANTELDLLVVVDDSASAATRQRRLASVGEAVADVLALPDMGIHLRIGFTTTDVGNVACPETSAEQGALVASSCVDRLDDFVDGPVDAGEICEDVCATAFDLAPTTTAVDPVPAPRPWLEATGGVGNWPATLTAGEAFACVAPQGIAGCEFVAPLEAAHRALQRARTPGDPAYGFLRETAHLAVVFVTDAIDCSSPVERQGIFLRPDQCDDPSACTQVFWSDPDASAPTPAVCWNAAARCEGGEAQVDGTVRFDSCVAVDRAADGAETTPENAVLHPISRYVSAFDELRAAKRGAGAEVRVHAITGVDISAPGAPLPWRTSADPEQALRDGIAPACEDGDGVGFGTPALRLRDVVQAQEDDVQALTSVCADDYSEAFDGVVDLVRSQSRPGCLAQCVRDVVPETAALDPECEVREIVDGAEAPIPMSACIRVDGDWAQPDDAAHACWFAITDPEELPQSCVDEGAMLELEVLRTVGHPAASNSRVEVACTPCA